MNLKLDLCKATIEMVLFAISSYIYFLSKIKLIKDKSFIRFIK